MLARLNNAPLTCHEEAINWNSEIINSARHANMLIITSFMCKIDNLIYHDLI